MEIHKTPDSRLSTVDFNNLDFGRVFSDHMIDMTYKNGSWSEPKIVPYAPITFYPSMHALHYGQEVFEGMKAYHADDETINLFRIDDHHERISNSSSRMCIPAMQKEAFTESLKELIRLDHKWVPKTHGHALYVRPFIFASEEFIAARAASEYRYIVITCPVAAYYKEGFNPVSLTTTDNFVRAVKGGTGEAKAAGNYGGSFLPAQKAQKEGYTQVLWLDAKENKYVEEVGTMNIFFKINGKLVTPELGGTVLPGITRRSVITLAREWNIDVEERRISINDVFEAHKDGSLEEVFGAGTAAVISPVGLIHHQGKTIELDREKIGPFAKKMYDTITGIQYGKLDDPYGWVHPVKV
ncbi:MAG: branched-chain amino acid aminotransferase [Balneolaceae bacterium]